MMSAFHAGFANELVKQAGIRDVVRRAISGKPIPKMGFFQRRRIAKALGIKPDAVERVLLERQQRDRLTKGLVAAGGGVGGALLGSELSKRAGDAMVSKTTLGPKNQGNIGAAASVGALLGKRDALMASRTGATPAPTAPPPAPTGIGQAAQQGAQRGALLGKRDALMEQRRQRQNEDLLKRRDDLMKRRQAAPGPVASR